jgi:hypothetical protein
VVMMSALTQWSAFLGAIDVALGAAAAGAYTNSNELWVHLEKVRNVSFIQTRRIHNGIIIFTSCVFPWYCRREFHLLFPV